MEKPKPKQIFFKYDKSCYRQGSIEGVDFNFLGFRSSLVPKSRREI